MQWMTQCESKCLFVHIWWGSVRPRWLGQHSDRCAGLQSAQNVSDSAAELYAKLQQLCWCPVMMFPPCPDVPFNVPSSPLAPPKLARPVCWQQLILVQDAWQFCAFTFMHCKDVGQAKMAMTRVTASAVVTSQQHSNAVCRSQLQAGGRVVSIASR